MKFDEWGAVMRLARRAAMLASEEQRVLGRISDPLESSIMLYTDDPTTAGLFLTERDMATICKASAIEGVAIVMGENFPPAAHEAERDDLELPRVAAMWFPPMGAKCPRCRNYTVQNGDEICGRCSRVVSGQELIRT